MVLQILNSKILDVSIILFYHIYIYITETCSILLSGRRSFRKNKTRINSRNNYFTKMPTWHRNSRGPTRQAATAILFNRGKGWADCLVPEVTLKEIVDEIFAIFKPTMLRGLLPLWYPTLKNDIVSSLHWWGSKNIGIWALVKNHR